MDLFLFPGGSKTTNFHNDPAAVALAKMPEQVAGEFGRGDFTLGVPFVPTLSTRQNKSIEAMNLDPNVAFVPFTVWLVAVPEECSTDSIGLRIEPKGSSSKGIPQCQAIDNDGFTFDVVRQKFDNAKVKAGDLAGAPIGTASTIGTGGLDADAYTFTRTAMAQHVPSGQTMLIGIHILTPPDAGIDMIAAMPCRITPVVKVHDYQNPLQIM